MGWIGNSPSQGVADISNQNLYGMRNRIINGDMRIDQRNAGASLTVGSGSTAGGYLAYPVDRLVAQSYSTVAGNGAAFTTQRNQGSVTLPAGFTNYVGMTVTSTQATLQNDSVYRFIHRIEGLNTADWSWGTADASTVTVSFLARSSVTGLFGGAVSNANGGVSAWRVYPFTFSINSANTWEYKTITIPGDTSGTWRTNTECGVEVSITLGVSSTWGKTPGVWGTAEGYGAAGTVNLMATSGATFQLTGLQIEKGIVATEFERRMYGQELALCQRYYQIVPFVGTGVTTGEMGAAGVFKVTMRTPPSLNSALRHPPSYNSSSNQIISYGVGPANVGSAAFSSVSADFFGAILCTGLTVGAVYGGSTTASAEL